MTQTTVDLIDYSKPHTNGSLSVVVPMDDF